MLPRKFWGLLCDSTLPIKNLVILVVTHSWYRTPRLVPLVSQKHLLATSHLANHGHTSMVQTWVQLLLAHLAVSIGHTVQIPCLYGSSVLVTIQIKRISTSCTTHGQEQRNRVIIRTKTKGVRRLIKPTKRAIFDELSMPTNVVPTNKPHKQLKACGVREKHMESGLIYAFLSTI